MIAVPDLRDAPGDRITYEMVRADVVAWGKDHGATFPEPKVEHIVAKIKEILTGENTQG